MGKGKGKRKRQVAVSHFLQYLVSRANTVPWTGTPEKYARQIYSFSRKSTRDSFYPGEHYDCLAQFLIRSYHTRTDKEIIPTRENTADFLTLHKLNDGDGNKTMRFGSLEEFESYTNNHDAPQILFLKGYPSPKWLCSIGAKYDVDPEFFFPHFNFSSPGMPEYSGFPPQPSSTNVIQLRVISLGCWNTLRSGESG